MDDKLPFLGYQLSFVIGIQVTTMTNIYLLLPFEVNDSLLLSVNKSALFIDISEVMAIAK